MYRPTEEFTLSSSSNQSSVMANIKCFRLRQASPGKHCNPTDQAVSMVTRSQRPSFSLMIKPGAMRTIRAGAPLFYGIFFAYIFPATCHGTALDGFSQWLFGSSLPPNGRWKLSVLCNDLSDNDQALINVPL